MRAVFWSPLRECRRAQRAGFDDANKATADQLRAAWGPLVADAGTFTVSGNTMKWTRLVAKNAPQIASGNYIEWTYTLSGDSLVITRTQDQAGPLANPATVRMTRAK